MRILVAGAHGLTGRRLLTQLQHANILIAITRDATQKQALQKFGAYDILEADLVKDKEIIEQEMKKHHYDAFIFAAGAASKTRNVKTSPEMTTAVDRDAAIAMADLCQKYHTTLLLLSSIGAEDPEQESIPDSLRHYLRMKYEADEHVKNLGKQEQNPLQYIIFRPGSLNEDKPTGLVTVRDFIPIGTEDEISISRDDVAAVVVKALELHNRLNHRILYFTHGDTDISEALWQISKSSA